MMNAADKTAAVALDIEFEKTESGYNFDKVVSVIPVTWDEWIKLPIREFDDAIHSPTLTIRAPRVIVATAFRKIPLKKFKPNKKTIYNRDKGVCSYSGKKLSYGEATLDHVVPRSRGGKSSFSNLVLCHKDVNYQKADRTPAEAGLRLLTTPREPTPQPISALIREARKKEWETFLFKH